MSATEAITATKHGLVGPGVYDLDEEEYHRDPVEGGSLSNSEAKLLLPPSCPALFRYRRDNPSAPSRDMELGSAAHRVVLGVGPEVEVVDARDWRTKAAKEAAQAARDAGRIPVLPPEWEMVTAMARALRQNPVAAALLDPSRGKPEQVLVWPDPDTGIMRRARLDWLPDPTSSGRLIIPDYKTTTCAHPDTIRKTVDTYQYYMQDFVYSQGAQVLGLSDQVAFVFLFQEKRPPYLVQPVELHHDARDVAAGRNRKALDIYTECMATDKWPGYYDGIARVGLPAWVRD